MIEFQLPSELRIQYDVTHSHTGLRCHYFSDDEIDYLITEYKIIEVERDELWEFLDIKTAHAVHGTNTMQLQSIKTVREALRLLRKAIKPSKKQEVARLLLIDPSEADIVNQPIFRSWDVAKHKLVVREARALLQVAISTFMKPPEAKNIENTRSGDVKADSDTECLPELNELISRALQIDPAGKAGPNPNLNLYKRWWIEDVVEFWEQSLNRTFSSKFEGEREGYSKMIGFVYDCYTAIDRNASVGMVAGPISDISLLRNAG